MTYNSETVGNLLFIFLFIHLASIYFSGVGGFLSFLFFSGVGWGLSQLGIYLDTCSHNIWGNVGLLLNWGYRKTSNNNYFNA